MWCKQEYKNGGNADSFPFPFPSSKGTLVEGQVDKHRCPLTVEGALNKKLPMGSGEGEAAGVGVESTEWARGRGGGEGNIFMLLSFPPHSQPHQGQRSRNEGTRARNINCRGGEGARLARGP